MRQRLESDADTVRDQLSERLRPTYDAVRPIVEEMTHGFGAEFPDRCAWIDKLSFDLGDENLPELMRRLRPKADGRRDWAGKFHRSVVVVMDGIRAAHYHLQRIAELELELTNRFKGIDLSKLERGGTMAAVFPALDYEYQAFLFAARRTLDYFASSVSAAIKTECYSMTHLTDVIDKQATEQGRAEMLRILGEHSGAYESFVSRDGKRSARDLTAHYEPASAGTVNVVFAPRGVFLSIVGGAEGLRLKMEMLGGLPTELATVIPRADLDDELYPVMELSATLDAKLERIEQMIRSVYDYLLGAAA